MPADFPQTWIALADAQRAMRFVRGSAAGCGIDPQRIGVIGFSAGGHNASQLETRPAVTTPNTDAFDPLDARPNFGLLLYPVISMDPAITHSGSRNNLIGSSPTPSDVLLSLKAAQVPEELHLYNDGAHGTGIRLATGDMANGPLRQPLGSRK